MQDILKCTLFIRKITCILELNKSLIVVELAGLHPCCSLCFLLIVPQGPEISLQLGGSGILHFLEQ